MDQILHQIKGVVGVTGVMVYDPDAHHVHYLLPSRFEEEQSEEFRKLFKTLVSSAETQIELRLRFQNGWCVVLSMSPFSVLVLGREDLNFDTLEIVARTSLKSASRSTGMISETSREKEFSPRSVYTLIEAVNVISKVFAHDLGTFAIADLLRKVKKALLADFPLLKHFVVDNNGSVSLIRGSEKHMTPEVVDAVAWLCYCLKEEVNSRTPVVGYDIKRATAEIEYQLSPIGFYSSYKRAASRAVKVTEKMASISRVFRR